MNKINIITYPDYLFSDCFKILLIHPSTFIKDTLQKDYLSQLDTDVNIYYCENKTLDHPQIDWLLNAFSQCDLCIFDIDNSSQEARNLAAYFLAKPKTYWLTNVDKPVYNHISNNRVFNLDFLNGGYFGKTQ